MKELKEDQAHFSQTNWEIATTIVGTHYLLGLSSGDMDIEQMRREIIQDVYFAHLLDIRQERINTGLCDEKEMEMHNTMGHNIIIMQLMNDYTAYIDKHQHGVDSILKLDLPLHEKGVEELVENMSFPSEEDNQLAITVYSEFNLIAHDILNNKEVLKIIIKIYKILSSDAIMDKKHLSIYKTLVELKYVDTKKFSWG